MLADHACLLINLAINVGAFEGRGYGESVGAMIETEGLDIPSSDQLGQIIVESLDNDPERAAAAIPALVEALKGKDAALRRAAASALGPILRDNPAKSARGVSELVEAVKGKDSDLRWNAAAALAEIAPKAAPDQAPKVAVTLSEALKDRNKYLRRRAADGLAKIRPELGPSKTEKFVSVHGFGRHGR